LRPGDVVVGVMAGAQETKVRPAVGIASATYLAERSDVLVGILTTKLPKEPGSTDHILLDGDRQDSVRSRASEHTC
jgi:mRNA-degrading endonuclease toxin of MazEF toxin-antitoxin module